MIIGILLALFISISLTSLVIIVTGTLGMLRENLITGAVIGTSGVISYAIITFILSLIATLFLALVLKNPHSINKKQF